MRTPLIRDRFTTEVLCRCGVLSKRGRSAKVAKQASISFNNPHVAFIWVRPASNISGAPTRTSVVHSRKAVLYSTGQDMQSADVACVVTHATFCQRDIY